MNKSYFLNSHKTIIKQNRACSLYQSCSENIRNVDNANNEQFFLLWKLVTYVTLSFLFVRVKQIHSACFFLRVRSIDSPSSRKSPARDVANESKCLILRLSTPKPFWRYFGVPPFFRPTVALLFNLARTLLKFLLFSSWRTSSINFDQMSFRLRHLFNNAVPWELLFSFIIIRSWEYVQHHLSLHCQKYRSMLCFAHAMKIFETNPISDKNCGRSLPHQNSFRFILLYRLHRLLPPPFVCQFPEPSVCQFLLQEVVSWPSCLNYSNFSFFSI